MSLNGEIQRRRTFAIISHPDAGKTTLTEKLLLFGGGIRQAGAVKSNKIRRTTTSDFMEIERQRGISVSTAVMSFEYGGRLINILDTPGHKDFAEDTYRTLTAVDSVILVVDSVKGVEEQTEKLMKVCRLRRTPVIVFINKLDREGKRPLELIDELDNKLNIKVRPLSWPVGSGSDFKGVYNLHDRNLYLFHPGKTVVERERRLFENLDDPLLDTALGREATRLREAVELIEGVYEPFSPAEYLAGRVAPVFFGSALNNFGVRELLETFLRIAPPPVERKADKRRVAPHEEHFSGFVFKIHANLDPRHRDRIAFLRVCSGRFQRYKPFRHVRLGKHVRFSTAYSFMAREKNMVEEAYPGDVIGLYDRGDFKIGDTLTEGEELTFHGIPNFSPELFKEVVNTDPLRHKQLDSGIRQLTEEGVAQLFVQNSGRRRIVGAVGALQFDIIQHRLVHEYGAACRMETLPYARACWITSREPAAITRFRRFNEAEIATDREGKLVYLAESEWSLRGVMERYPEVDFHFTSELDGSEGRTGLPQWQAAGGR
ncbi:MAG: peptide chain release factor 3 [Spirochaetales bacterium]|nr:peptide chain release factor 3 [Spirochaetales bacterium]